MIGQIPKFPASPATRDERMKFCPEGPEGVLSGDSFGKNPNIVCRDLIMLKEQ